jgi:hypothetical protein
MFTALTLIGAAMFGASLYIEQRQPAGGAATKTQLIEALRLGGVVLATVGASGIAILASVNATPM